MLHEAHVHTTFAVSTTAKRQKEKRRRKKRGPEEEYRVDVLLSEVEEPAPR